MVMILENIDKKRLRSAVKWKNRNLEEEKNDEDANGTHTHPTEVMRIEQRKDAATRS